MAKKRTAEEKRLIKDIYNLKRNIERRFTNIEKRGLSSPSLDTYKYRITGTKKKYEYNEKILKHKKRYYDSSVKGKNINQLQTIYNRLKNLNNLKTANVKGAIHYTKKVIPLFEKIGYFGGKNQYTDRINELYNKFVDENRLLDRFKYDILDYIADNVEKSDEEIHDEINDLYNDLENGNKEIKYKYSKRF